MCPIVEVKVTYKGKDLNKKYLDKHLDLQHLYPSQELFMNTLYLPLFQIAKETYNFQSLEISEVGVKINGIAQLLH